MSDAPLSRSESAELEKQIEEERIRIGVAVMTRWFRENREEIKALQVESLDKWSTSRIKMALAAFGLATLGGMLVAGLAWLGWKGWGGK
jgi:hypothetical protein